MSGSISGNRARPPPRWVPSAAIGIHVEHTAVPGQPRRLDLKFLRIAVPVAVHGDLGADRNDPLVQTSLLGASRWRQDDIPDLTVRANLHRRMWACETHRRFDGAGDFRCRVEVATPAMVGAHR